MPAPYTKLPQSIKDLLLSEKLVDDIERIGAQNGLRPEEYGPLLRVTAKLLEGEISTATYVPMLIEELGLSREKVLPIAQEINRDIFNPIKEELRQVHALPEAPTVQLPPQATAPIAVKEALLPTPPPAKQPLTPSTPIISNTTPLAPPTLPMGMSFVPKAPAQGLATEVKPPVLPPLVSAPVKPVSVFEQKMSGTFRLKSDAPSYSAPVVATAATPQSQTPPTLQMPPPQNSVVTPKASDSYRESI